MISNIYEKERSVPPNFFNFYALLGLNKQLYVFCRLRIFEYNLFLMNSLSLKNNIVRIFDIILL